MDPNVQNPKPSDPQAPFQPTYSPQPINAYGTVSPTQSAVPTPSPGNAPFPLGQTVLTPTEPTIITPTVTTPVPIDPFQPQAVVVGGPGNAFEQGGGMGGTGDPTPVAPTIGGTDPGSAPVPAAGRKKKPLLIGAGVAVVLIGLAAFYFGYYTNPSVIYSQALANTGKGYDKLISYADTQSKIQYKGSEGSGSFSYKSLSFSTDGKLAFKSDSNNGEFTFDVGAGVSRVSADVRYLKSSTKTPDLYLKAGGLKGMGSLLGFGSPQIDAAVNKYDNTWIAIDHTMLDNLQGSVAAAAGSSSAASPNRADILDELRAFGRVNQQYLFSTNKDKAITTVVKKYGVENTGGHRAYHYKVALNKANVKKYITAQQAALKASKLGDWLKKNNYESSVNSSFGSLQQSADSIKSSDTFEVWADMGKRIIYKLRFNNSGSNPAENYVDVGLDYKGGDNYPFFISGQSKSSGQTTSGSLIATLHTKSNGVDFKLSVKNGGSSGGTLEGDFSYKPTTASVQIAKPPGAVPLAQVLSELGFGDVLNSYLQSAPAAASSTSSGGSYTGVQGNAKDSKRQSDIKAMQTQIEAYFAQQGNYPSFGEFNSASWRKTSMATLDDTALQDPDSNGKALATNPAAKIYAYQVTDANGGSCEADSLQCVKYTLTATLSNGKPFAVTQLN